MVFVDFELYVVNEKGWIKCLVFFNLRWIGLVVGFFQNYCNGFEYQVDVVLQVVFFVISFVKIDMIDKVGFVVVFNLLQISDIRVYVIIGMFISLIIICFL